MLSEMRQSNPLLEQCIQEYSKVLDLPDLPKELAIKAGTQGVNRMQFRGKKVTDRNQYFYV